MPVVPAEIVAGVVMTAAEPDVQHGSVTAFDRILVAVLPPMFMERATSKVQSEVMALEHHPFILICCCSIAMAHWGLFMQDCTNWPQSWCPVVSMILSGRTTNQSVEFVTEAYPELVFALHGVVHGPTVSHTTCPWL